MSKDTININWVYSGKTDFLLGTGATRAEQLLAWVTSLAGVVLYIYFYLEDALSWTWWQYLLAAIIAFDVVGGVVANSLNSCKRFYHTPPKSEEPPYTAVFKNHLVFSALHVHPLVIALVYGNGDYFNGVFWYVTLLIATLVILKAPLYLQRPLSFFAIIMSLLLNLYVVAPIRGFEWFVPALFMKIVYGHLVREEPYRPPSENGNRVTENSARH
ncbi:MAG: hypothetical protein GXP38_08820 [Chloroflexi bacterium]|nr:hypothetical protein [Chloroflexota bacterium]